VRERFFTPRLKVASYDELNAWLLDRCIAYAKAHKHPELTDQTVWQVFEAERAHLVPVANKFDGFHATTASVSKTCLVRFDNNKYSVASRAVGRPVEIQAYADRIVLRQDGAVVAEHPRCMGRGQTIYDPWHYVPVLARKPGALRDGAPFKDWLLPSNLERVRRKLRGADDGDRQMVKVLAAVLTDVLASVDAACAEALGQGVHSADVIINILARRKDPGPPVAQLKLYGMRAGFDEVMATGIKRSHEPLRIVGDLLSAEIAEKQARSIKYQITTAKLPLAKDIDDFDFCATPINEALVRDLAGGGFIAAQRNAVLVGGTGTGKSHLAIAIARACIRGGARGRFFTVVDLVNRLEAEARAGRQGRLADFAMRLDFLVLDELGYLPFAQAGGQLLFPSDQQALCEDLDHCHHQARLRRMAERVRRCQNDHRPARPADASLRHHRNRQRKLALQKPRLNAAPEKRRFMRPRVGTTQGDMSAGSLNAWPVIGSSSTHT